jgi:hypothetical protein
MSPQIRLEIDTGNGNTALAANCGSINSQYLPLFDIAFRGQPIADLHRQGARDVERSYLDSAIDTLRNDRRAFAGLTAVEQDYRPTVLVFCENWRDKCREHPNCVVYLVP